MVMPANLGELIAAYRPNAVPPRDYRVQDDGAGPYIAHWDAVAMGTAMPTEAQVLAFKAQAEADIAAARAARQQAIDVCKAYNRTTATAAEVRNTLGAALYLLREVIREIRS